jgi:hypothetical protein
LEALVMPLEMENGEEIEYFGFIPVLFTTELREAMETTITSFGGLEGLPRSRLNNLLALVKSMFSRNFYIYENFVLRNILSFPKTFKLERKRTDLRYDFDLQSLVDEYLALVDEEVLLNTEMVRVQGLIAIEEYKKKEYEKMMGHVLSLRKLVDGTLQLKSRLAAIRSSYHSFSDGESHGRPKLNELMSHKEIRDEMYKKERDGLFSISSLECLENLNRRL